MKIQQAFDLAKTFYHYSTYSSKKFRRCAKYASG